ncbi:MAG: FG-GAP-like repeat-containing protein [Candidatus Krumholzibacteriia bacterium]
MFRAIPLIILALSMAAPSLAADILLTIPRPPEGYAQTEYFGKCVAALGDLDGDGFTEYLVGMPASYYNNTNNRGHAYVYRGGPALDPQPLLVMEGPFISSKFGGSVTALGDFDADGHPDFAVGQPTSLGRPGETSGVHVFFGGPALDGQADLVLFDDGGPNWFGGTVTGGHDFNGDGYPDLAVGAHAQALPSSGTGRVTIYFGGPAADAVADMILDGPAGCEDFGYTLCLGPDVTGDGLADLAVLSWVPNQVHVYAGGPGADAAADFTVDLLPLGTKPLFTSYHGVYPSAVKVTMGDVSADGQADLIIGMPTLYGDQGQVWVLFGGTQFDTTVDRAMLGRKSGDMLGCMLDASGDYDGDGWNDLAVGARGPGENWLRGYLAVYAGGGPLGQKPMLVTTSDDPFSRFGRAAVSLGDIDGDGADEMVVGSQSPFGYVWILDEMFYDCNGDGIPDLDQIGNGLADDCDNDFVPDACQIVLWPEEECTGNGVPDACDLAADPSFDCDGNGLIDACEIADDPSLDCDGNGVFDSCQLAADPTLDCDHDGVFDACEIGADPSLDCDGDGRLDACQLAADPSLDCDGNGIFDACQFTADPSLDSDQDEILDFCQFPGTLALYTDPAFTDHDLTSGSVGLVGPFSLVLNLPPGSQAVTRVELTFELSGQLAGPQVNLEPGIGYDADPTAEGLVLFMSPLTPDAQGNVVLATVSVVLLDGAATDQVIRIAGNVAPSGHPDFGVPIWGDEGDEIRVVSTTLSGFVNRTISDAPPTPIRVLAVANHPNPFNPRTTIRMDLPGPGTAELTILDLSGRAVRRAAIDAAVPGPREFVWQGRDDAGRPVASGVYLIQVVQGSARATAKAVLLK